MTVLTHNIASNELDRGRTSCWKASLAACSALKNRARNLSHSARPRMPGSVLASNLTSISVPDAPAHHNKISAQGSAACLSMQTHTPSPVDLLQSHSPLHRVSSPYMK